MSKSMEAISKRYPCDGREYITFAKPHRRLPAYECEKSSFHEVPIYESIDVPTWIVKLIYKSGFEDGQNNENT